MFILTVWIDGTVFDTSEYSQLNHVFSRIKQLDTEYKFLEIEKPNRYEIKIK